MKRKIYGWNISLGFARILRIEAHKIGYTSNFTIYDSDDSQKLVSRIIKEFNLDKDSISINRFFQEYHR